MHDAAWIASVVERFEGPLVRYAARLAGDLERGRDVVQETFFRLTTAPREHVEPRLAEWLYTVCRNGALSVRRKEGRMAVLDTKTLSARESETTSPSKRLEASEGKGRLRAVVENLSERQREVVRLRFQDGLSYKEIAGVLELSVSNVGVILHEALKKLRVELGAGPSLSTTERSAS